VLSVREAGPVEQGAGHVVTGTFQTWNADVRELWMEGLEAPVRVTGGHRFYSASRGWVEAHRLAVGETVRTRDGSGARVLGLERLPGVHAVFNLEVEGLHQYHVSPLGLLAHNNSKCETTNTSAQNTKGANEAAEFRGGSHRDMTKPKGDGLDSHHMPADSVNGIPKTDGPAIQMDKADHKKTSSYGGGDEADTYRREIKNMIDGGDMRKAMATEIYDVRRVAKEVGNPRKYNGAMRQMMEYARDQKIIPPNPQKKLIVQDEIYHSTI
jgi:hypothetical protein